MSEARQQRNVPREVPSAPQTGEVDNLAARLAEFARTYVGKCEGYHYPLTPPDNQVGQPKTAEDVLLLNWVRMKQGEGQALRELNKLSEVERNGMSDAQTVAFITKHVSEWKPSTKLAGVFRETALHRALDMITYELLRESNRPVAASYDAECKAETDKARAAKEKAISTMLTQPDRADKYEQRARAKLAAIFAERYNPVRRSKGGSADTAGETDDEIDI